MVEDVWIGTKGQAVDVRQFISTVAGSLAGKIDRGDEARFIGIIMPDYMPDYKDVRMTIVMELGHDPIFD